MKNRASLALTVLLAAALSSPAAAQQAQPQPSQQQSQQRQSDYQTADKFKDMAVKSREGKEVGKIGKVIVDMKTGQIAYFTLARGGVGGMGQESYIIPWNAMAPDPRGKGMVLQVPREKLRLAPAGDDIEKQLTRQMGEEIAGHYGVAPYWESTEGQQPGGTPQQPSTQQRQPQQPQTPPVQTQGQSPQ